MFYVYASQYGFQPEAFTSSPPEAHQVTRNAPCFEVEREAWDWIARVAYKRLAMAQDGYHRHRIGSHDAAVIWAETYGWKLENTEPCDGRGVVATYSPMGDF